MHNLFSTSFRGEAQGPLDLVLSVDLLAAVNRGAIVTGQRSQYISWIGLALTAASVAGSGYAASQKPPAPPDGASASREVAQAQAAELPINRQIAAAEQEGGSADVPVAKQKQTQQWARVVSSTPVPAHLQGRQWVPASKQSVQWVPYKPEDWQQGGKYFQEGQGPPKLQNRQVMVPAHTEHADFNGYGTADIEGKLAQQMADIQTNLGAKYGTQFATEAAREAALADPEGTKARQIEHDLITDQINNPKPINPLSTSLDTGIDAQLKAGPGFDAVSQDLLDHAVGSSNDARGGGGASSDDVSRVMSTGREGAARRQAGINKAQAWLSSGSTPEDIAYRREQQNLTNLGAFVGGRTPESEFQNLSGAGQGATPFYPGGQLPQQPNNAGVGAPYSIAAWQDQLRSQQGQANGWMAGLSSLLSGAGAFAGATGK